MMNLESFLKRRQESQNAAPAARTICRKCRKPQKTCYCAQVRPFDCDITFVILIHRHEARNGVATGRMAHLILKNSRLFEGTNFTHHRELNELLSAPDVYPVVLYPAKDAVTLNSDARVAPSAVFPPGKRPVVIIIDGTWSSAKRMRRLSRNLHGLPTVALALKRPSNFRVRRQPRPECLSTLEAIHAVLDGFAGDPARPHDNLLTVFDYMVETQLGFREQNGMRAVRGLRR